MQEKINFEKAMEDLEHIVADLEKGETTLDEAMALFEKGVSLVGACTKVLDESEQKVVKLVGGKEEPFEVPKE